MTIKSQETYDNVKQRYTMSFKNWNECELELTMTVVQPITTCVQYISNKRENTDQIKISTYVSEFDRLLTCIVSSGNHDLKIEKPFGWCTESSWWKWEKVGH